jgi:RNA polymerase sigma-70 factor (ECF subfamily)
MQLKRHGARSDTWWLQAASTLPSMDTAAFCFDRELSQHLSYLVRVARRRLPDCADAEDAVQDTLLAAIESRERYAQRGSLRSWLTGILLHKLGDRLRREHRGGAGDDADSDDIWTVPGAREWRDPERVIESRQLMAVLHQGLQSLPRQAARAFTLREIDGLDTGEASRELDVSLGQCAVLLHRARTRLRRRLESFR